MKDMQDMQDTPLWQSRDLALAFQTPIAAPLCARGISIDTRTLQKGDLFFALSGEVGDGHRYVNDALEQGAAGAVVRAAHKMRTQKNVLRVADPLAALQRLARAARARSTAQLVAITGSCGKTSVKEGLAVALGGEARVHVAQASYNNHIGVPLSLARMPAATRIGVFELGMNHRGEIAALAHLLRPHIGVITNIAAAHHEFFPSLDAIAEAKAELFGGLSGAGIAILPRASDHWQLLYARARAAGVRRVRTFGFPTEDDGARADVSCERHYAAPEGGNWVWARLRDARVRDARVRDARVRYRLAQAGAHAVENSLVVLAATQALGLDAAQIAARLAQWQASPRRGERHWLRVRKGRALLIDDSYNANPRSMAAALAVLGAEGDARTRRIAVLGDMHELGDAGARLHRDLAALIAQHKISHVYAVGPLMGEMFAALPAAQRRRGARRPSLHGLRTMLARDLRAGDVVLIKGSRALGMERLVQALLPREKAPRPHQEAS